MYTLKNKHIIEHLLTVSGTNVLSFQTTNQGLQGVRGESETGEEEQHNGTDCRL
jgi:hypothetical protein